MTGSVSEPPRRAAGWTALLGLCAAIALIAYPLLVWYGLSRGSPRTVSLVVLAIVTPSLVLRLRHSSRAAVRGLIAVPLMTMAVLLFGALLDAGDCVLAVPVVTSAVLLAAFASTQRRGSMPMIERFARLQTQDLGPRQVAWCRLWTWMWCAFFAVNGTIAALLAAMAPLSWWAFYNGLLSYLLMGAIFVAEWLLRGWRFPELREKRAQAAERRWAAKRENGR